MKVSIIITNYNKAPYLKEAIESALNQTYANFEVLIIDDGSTDNSREIINAYAEDERVRIILQENQGIVKTRNRAIKEAAGKFIVQLDGDDVLFDGFIAEAIAAYEVDDQSKIVYGTTHFIGAKKGLWDLGRYDLQKQLLTNQIVVSALFAKKDFEKVGGYDQAFKIGYEDWDFWLNLISNGAEVLQLDTPMLKYRILEDSRNKAITLARLNEIRALIVDKYHGFYSEHFPNPIALAWEIEGYKELEKSRNLLLASAEFRLGKFLLKPYRILRRVFSL